MEPKGLRGRLDVESEKEDGVSQEIFLGLYKKLGQWKTT